MSKLQMVFPSAILAALPPSPLEGGVRTFQVRTCGGWLNSQKKRKVRGFIVTSLFFRVYCHFKLYEFFKKFVWSWYGVGISVLRSCYWVVFYFSVMSNGSMLHTNLQASRKINAALKYALYPDLVYASVQALVT